MRNYFIYDGEDSRDYGVYISGSNVFNAPERSINTVTVPGRNGTLTIDNGRFENIDLEYPAFIYDNFKANIADLRNFLLSAPGYRRLEDTYHPNEYRMARYISGLEVAPTDMRTEGEFNLVFDCMPQRFLKSGEEETELTSSGSVINPTEHAARPMMRVYGTGILGVGSESVTITTNPAYIDIDCEMMDAYYGTTNCNSYITLSSGEFPVLSPGYNGITLGTGITKVIITPRYWII